MGLTIGQRKAVTREMVREYRRGTRRENGRILDRLVAVNGYTRNHASWLLRCWGRTVFSYQGGRLVTLGYPRGFGSPQRAAMRPTRTPSVPLPANRR